MLGHDLQPNHKGTNKTSDDKAELMATLVERYANAENETGTSLESGKFGPRVASSVSRSSCLR
jgi:hypothetical protein